MTKLKISFRGHKDYKEKARKVLPSITDLERMNESAARLKIQECIDREDLKATVLVNGNSVWSRKRVLRNLQRILKHGALFDNGQPVLSRYFYLFLHLECGSIAHYNINGWISHYPLVADLRQFFKSNEFGQKVVDWIPQRHSDARLIAAECERKLFPFQTYMKTHKT